MDFNAPGDVTKKMLWGLSPVMTCFMMFNRRAHLARSNVYRSFIAGRYYVWLILPEVVLLVLMASAGAQS